MLDPIWCNFSICLFGGWVGLELERLLKRQRPLKTFDFVIPGTSTISGKADEDGVQERTKED